jgi:hypothetical protein
VNKRISVVKGGEKKWKNGKKKVEKKRILRMKNGKKKNGKQNDA